MTELKLVQDNTNTANWEDFHSRSRDSDGSYSITREAMQAAIEQIQKLHANDTWMHDIDAGPPVDTRLDQSHTEPMNEITRQEFNAKLETIEVKMDARVESVSAKIEAFLSAQTERDKTQLERDKRYELLADRVTRAAEGAEEAAKQAATVKSNYWAAVGVQLFAVAAILIGAYFATQANTLSAISTTLSAFQAGKSEAPPAPQPKQQAPSD